MPSRSKNSFIKTILGVRFRVVRRRVYTRRKNSLSSKVKYEEHKESARALVTERLAHFNLHYGFRYKRISIRNVRSRWGSCSRLGNLNFSYKIALLSPELADYIVVHELCHLGQFNHSQKFWDLVGQTIPDYKDQMMKLRGTSIF